MTVSMPTWVVLPIVLGVMVGFAFLFYALLLDTPLERWYIRLLRGELWPDHRQRRQLKWLALAGSCTLIGSLFFGWHGTTFGLSFIPFMLIEWAYARFDYKNEMRLRDLDRRHDS